MFDINDFNSVCEVGRMYLNDYAQAAENPRGAQEKFLMELLKDNENTEYGRKHGFSNIKSIDDYRHQVPVTEYADYESYICRMTDGDEESLISAYPIVHYATSSGSTGKPKRVPVSEKNMRLFSVYWGNMLLAELANQIEIQGKKPGTICILADLSWKNMKPGVTLGSLSSQLSYNFKNELDRMVSSPYVLQRPDEIIIDAVYLKALFALKHKDLSMIFATFSSAVYEFFRVLEANWESLVSSIRTGRIGNDVKISPEVREELSKHLTPDPERADELEREFRAGRRDNLASRIWPNLALIICIGAGGFSEYTERFKEYIGDIPIHMAGYAASESIMGIPLDINVPEYVLLVNCIFFEFVEVSDEKPDYTKTLLIDQLEDGKEYEVIISNMSGFYRYRMLDVIRIEGHKDGMPYGHIVYRLNQVSSMVGEKTNTEQLEYAVKKLAEHLNTHISDYALYPDYSVSPSRYILLVEPDGDIGRGIQPELGEFVDNILKQVNLSYEKYRHQATLGQPEVMFVETNTFRLYKDYKVFMGVSANQIKPVRIIDTEEKIKFFFGLAEDPYKAMKRVMFDLQREINRYRNLDKKYKLLSKLNAELQAENEALSKKIQRLEKQQ